MIYDLEFLNKLFLTTYSFPAIISHVMTESEARGEFKPVFGVIPPMIEGLNRTVNLVTVEKALIDLDLEDSDEKRYTPKYTIRINLVHSMEDPLIRQDFKGNEKDFNIARRWAETALKMGIPDNLQIDLTNVILNLALVREALIEAHHVGHPVSLSPTKPAV
jgi:hypothetical protein